MGNALFSVVLTLATNVLPSAEATDRALARRSFLVPLKEALL